MDLDHSGDARALRDDVRQDFERRRAVVTSADGWSPRAWATTRDPS